MKRCVAFLPLVLLLGVATGGCNPPQPVAGGNPAAAPSAPPPPPGEEPPPPPAAPSEAIAEAARSGPEGFAGIAGTGLLEEVQGTRPRGTPPAAPPAAEPAETELVQAKQKVGFKGRSLDEYEGVMVTPAKAYFAAKERIAFEVQVPHALQLYEAASGESPKTHDEFMKNVIEANQIKLPVLPPGHEYVYDPQSKQLMVKRPKR